MSIDRRRFIKASLGSAGGLLLGFHLPARAAASAAGVEINAWLQIDPDGSVLIRVAQSEMGQGVFTALPMIVAEELEVEWSSVRAEYVSANRHLRDDLVYKDLGTGGSYAVRGSRETLQAVGASARERLRLAAAARWKVPVAQCDAGSGRVHHGPTRRSLGYGELAAEAAQLRFDDAKVVIREPARFRLIGTPTQRLDVPAKVDGSTVYGVDVRLPGMLYAAVLHCPVFGGEVESHDAAAIAGMRGVVRTVVLPGAVAVVADSWWRASKALQALPIRWKPGVGAGSSSAVWDAEFKAELDRPGRIAEEQGDALGAIGSAATRVRGDYAVPYLAHASMEPLNCTVRIADGKLELWAGTQNPDSSLKAAADAAGMDPLDCEVHTCMLGGSFGRRLYPDILREAVLIAKAAGAPVQTIWSREEDMRRGCFRPMAAFRFEAGLDAKGGVAGFLSRSVTHSIRLSNGGDESKIDSSSIDSLAESPYAFGSRRVEHIMRKNHLHTWYWRSVGNSQNGWAMESFVDEIADGAGRDPLELRRELLAHRPDFLGVLKMLQERSGWGRREMPAGSAQGIAIHESFGTIVGQVAEVTVSRDGELRLDRMVSVVDCGHLVNPLGAEEQVESAIVYGLSAALHGRITVRDGAVVEGNFHDYPVLRLRDTPRMETYFALSGGKKWGGMGEPGLPPAAPAVCNAIFRATGKRIRALPIAGQDLSWGEKLG
jgi:isoquinoline 1-oxidoreductase beta subunit